LAVKLALVKKYLLKLLLPLSWIYGVVVFTRNKLFDCRILPSKSFAIPTIAIGNIAIGGTGKTPMASYLIHLLQKSNLPIGFVSKGYKRKSEGTVIANENTQPSEIGDEPYQILTKHPSIKLAVSKNRADAIETITAQYPDLNAIVLDDALQHRKITAGFNLLLTDYNNLYSKDNYLPAGELRDHKIRAKQAQIIVVTKCPSHLSDKEQSIIISELSPNAAKQKVYFTGIQYNRLSNIFKREYLPLDAIREADKIILITAIAKPKSLLNKIEEYNKNVTHIEYSDHHDFSSKEIGQITQMFNNFALRNKTLILTTEKDASRLLEKRQMLKDLAIWAVEVETYFIENKQNFENQIVDYVRNGKRNS
jgi:tetraacyldisaccharide 4'-kinase